MLRETNAKLRIGNNNSSHHQLQRHPSSDQLSSHQELLRRIERLQEQNRMLTDEVGRQSNRLTGLEHDKRSLVCSLLFDQFLAISTKF